MFNLSEELKSGGVYPTGPVSAWPQERNEKLQAEITALESARFSKQTPEIGMRPLESKSTSAKVKTPSVGRMAKGFMRTAGQAMVNGKVEREVREERYDTCKACPFFNPESKRCNDCGCFMEAKTWIGGDPDMLCPQKKWSR